MRKQNFLFSFAFLFILFSYSQTQAQNTAGKVALDEKAIRNEIEVTKLADSFLDSFIQYQDLDKIPAEFFDKDFKSRFVNDEDCMSDVFQDEKLAGQDQYKINITVHNFFNLLAVTLGANFDKKKYEESGKDFLYAKQLPPNIVEKFQRTKWLKFILEKDSDEQNDEPKTSVEVRSYLEEMSSLSNEMRIHLRSLPVRNSQNFLNARKESFKYYAAEPCESERCMGLPAGTPIFAVHQFMMCLQIAKIDGQWKIVQIYSVACED